MSKRVVVIALIVVATLTVIGVNLRLVTGVPADVATAADKWLSCDYTVEVMRGGDSLGGLGIRDVTVEIADQLKDNDLSLQCVIFAHDGEKQGGIIYFERSSDAFAYIDHCIKTKQKNEIIKMDWEMRAVYYGDKDIYYSLLC